MKSEQQYIELFTECRGLIDRHGVGVLNALRDEAFTSFCRKGFPTTKVERYKYTDVPAAFEADYGLNFKRLNFPVNPYEAFRCDVPNLSTSLYFMVNDAFYDKALPAATLPEGVIVCSLKEAAEKYADKVSAHYGKVADVQGDALTALNTMFVQDGLFVFVPRNVVVERPIQVVNVLRSDVDLMANRRVLVVMEQGAQARLLFCDHTVDEHKFLTTQVVEVFAEENARLDVYELEETHVKNTRFSNVYIRQQRNSVVNHYSITLHNGITRNLTDVVMAGEGAETHLYGLVIADKQQHVDNNTLMDHRATYCQSNQLYKYVLDEKSKGAFAGRILVRQEAQHTTSTERNANLCATKEARMFTQPMLEIYADDVKCSHGATVGQMDEQALFYMRQRGISQDEAKMLLKFAFAGEVVETIGLEALRDRLRHLIEKRFRGELGRCSGCAVCG